MANIFNFHSGTWPYTMTSSIDQTLHQFTNLIPNSTVLPILTLLPNFGGIHRTLQRVQLANRERLLLRTPGPVPFGTCICSNIETILSWTCCVYGPFEFRTSLGTSIFAPYSYGASLWNGRKPWFLKKKNAAADILRKSFKLYISRKGRDLSQSYDQTSYIQSKIRTATCQYKNVTKNCDYTTIADRLTTVSWSNNSYPTGVIKPDPNLSTNHTSCVIKRTDIWKFEKIINPPHKDREPTANQSDFYVYKCVIHVICLYTWVIK